MHGVQPTRLKRRSLDPNRNRITLQSSMTDTPAPGPGNEKPSSIQYTASEAPKAKGNGSGWILALSIMQTVGGVVMFAMSASAGGAGSPEAIGVLVVMLLLALVFFGLWIWGRKSPFPALLTTLVIFVSFHLLDAVLDPASLLRGILIKIVMFVGLVTATKTAYMAKREAELENAAT